MIDTSDKHQQQAPVIGTVTRVLQPKRQPHSTLQLQDLNTAPSHAMARDAKGAGSWRGSLQTLQAFHPQENGQGQGMAGPEQGAVYMAAGTALDTDTSPSPPWTWVNITAACLDLLALVLLAVLAGLLRRVPAQAEHKSRQKLKRRQKDDTDVIGLVTFS